MTDPIRHLAMRACRVISAALLALIAFAEAASAAPTCSGSQHLVDETLANGARWQLCWEVAFNDGVIYSEITYTPPGALEALVLAELSLAQIHVPYDDNGARFHDVTDFGAGGDNLNDLQAADCPGGTRLLDGTKHAVCKTVAGRGAAFDAGGHTQQGEWVELFSVSHIGAYNYIPVLRFHDDGAIDVIMGATGALQRLTVSPSELEHGWLLDPNTRIGLSHIHNYYYRLDFDIGGTPNDDIFERVESVVDPSGTTRTRTVTPFSVEIADEMVPDRMRHWRVRDAQLTNVHGHPISYQIVPLEMGHRDVGPAFEPFTHHDVYVTRQAADERYASHNSILGMTAPDDLSEFIVPAESIAGGDDLVVWFGVTFHHIPRDEDELRMHAHWNGFRLEPRDWFDASPGAPELPVLPWVALTATGLGIVALGARRVSKRRDRGTPGPVDPVL